MTSTHYSALIQGNLQAISIVSNHWEQSMRFYREALGYQLLDEGWLSLAQKKAFGNHLGHYAILGYEEGSVVRLLELEDKRALPNRFLARPWDNGLAVFEAGTPDIERAYWKVLRTRFGATTVPVEFEAEGPEPLGKVAMKSTGFIGPVGEQVFVTQILHRKGGQSLLQESSVKGINTPLNVVISMKNREPIEQFWEKILGIHPVNDLPLRQPEAAMIMGGPADMGFDMLLMGHGTERIGLEQHVYGTYHPDYSYEIFPCTFEKTGLASAAWRCPDLGEAEKRFQENGYQIISRVALPLRSKRETPAVVVVGPLGEIIELVES